MRVPCCVHVKTVGQAGQRRDIVLVIVAGPAVCGLWGTPAFGHVSARWFYADGSPWGRAVSAVTSQTEAGSVLGRGWGCEHILVGRACSGSASVVFVATGSCGTGRCAQLSRCQLRAREEGVLQGVF